MSRLCDLFEIVDDAEPPSILLPINSDHYVIGNPVIRNGHISVGPQRIILKPKSSATSLGAVRFALMIYIEESNYKIHITDLMQKEV